MSFARHAYSALVCALLPVALTRLAWRARREPGYRQHLGERFGLYEHAPGGKRTLWVHAVSVGETHAAEPLVRALLERYPNERIVLTHTTPAGRAAGQSLLGERVEQVYLPYDYPAAVARFLKHFRPRLGVLLETEVWPNLVHACSMRGIALHLVNARLSEKSFRGYARFAGLSHDMFGSLTSVVAQSEDDARRLRDVGARNVHVAGNLKFDVTPSPELIERGERWRAAYGDRRVLLAASTRDGEEALLLDHLSLLPRDTLFVIVPRHPQRFESVAKLIEQRGLVYVRRSEDRAPGTETRVVLGDSMGEMAAYYAACDLAFIGGSLLPFGGQNLIEACAIGRAVLVGPHTYNFAEAADRAIGCGAAARVTDAADLMRTATRLLEDDARRAEMCRRAVGFSRAYRGATERVMAMISAPATDLPQPDRFR
jgi:3-deoxy-D-manno-octulosonic-acid transferase